MKLVVLVPYNLVKQSITQCLPPLVQRRNVYGDPIIIKLKSRRVTGYDGTFLIFLKLSDVT